jgi:hypothetical protein
VIIPYYDLKKKNDKELISIAREMAEYLTSGKPGIWAVAKINILAIEEILKSREEMQLKLKFAS